MLNVLFPVDRLSNKAIVDEGSGSWFYYTFQGWLLHSAPLASGHSNASTYIGNSIS